MTQPMSEGELLWPELRRSLRRIASGLSNVYDREQIEAACAVIEADQRVRERLQAERATLLEALRPFARCIGRMTIGGKEVGVLYGPGDEPPNIDDFNRARAAVAASTQEK